MGCASAFAQQAQLELGKTEIGQNENFVITLTVQNGKISGYTSFPDIPGFRKGSPSTSSSTSVINGQVSSSYSVVQYYSPSKQGTFKLPPFSMTVNGKQLSSRGATIRVGAPVNQQAYDPFADFWGEAFKQDASEQEYHDVADDAFFAINVDKRQVYEGQSFVMDMAFYIAVTNQADLQFYQLPEQLERIVKAVKPRNAWEEQLRIDTISPEYVSIRGKQYRKYKFYESAFFPLSPGTLQIPAEGLKMIKYLQSSGSSFFGANQKETFKVYESAPLSVVVKPLPDSPFKGRVPVGDYQLIEQLNPSQVKTGQNALLRLQVKGEGNIASINAPQVKETDLLTFYPPSTTQQVNFANGHVFGTKTFDYYIEPQEPGTYALKDFVSFPFFNTRTGQYEVLYPKGVLRVGGESRRDELISRNDIGTFYQRVGNKPNSLRSRRGDNTPIWVVNGGILLIFGAALLAAFYRKRKP